MNAAEVNQMLPWLLRRENVALYENSKVIIGDRRKYPFEKVFVECTSVEEVAKAIEDMVTQGGGPAVAALYAMAMAARQCQSKPAERQKKILQEASLRLIRTRPTNTSLARLMEKTSAMLIQFIDKGVPAELGLLEWIEAYRDENYERYGKVGEYGASLIDDGDGVLTMCFAEISLLISLALAKKAGKQIHVFTPETRPYLQGARLTAPSVHEIGIPVQIIGDNMPAYILSQGKIQKYFTAADLVTLDGHVVNKIGTFQNAITAHYHGVPYFVFSGGADKKKPDRASIEIEEREPAEMKQCRGLPTTIPDIDAYYPAFDITPPHLVSGVVTQYGILNPYDLKTYFGERGLL
ncbi:MAG: s-methyl-5-thioribose-1-phosphate isomerase [Anaerolineaceae bacterium]|nr:s-methyl-5-thioribose-1-phosphate isomerase [Anaerolineaceae bacterium]